MSILFSILLATFIVSLISFVGILVFVIKEVVLDKVLLGIVAFSAGALIGGAFFHLLPEAIEKVGASSSLNVFIYTIIGFVTFYILEGFIKWHHHHSKKHPEIMAFSYLILISDSLHNFIDGVVIAASFVVSVPVGIVTTLAVALHEIPHEMGNFAVLVYGGFKKWLALFMNFFSACVAIIGGVAGFFLAEKLGSSVIFLLPFAAGNFIYVASSDLIPEVKKRAGFKESISYMFAFLMGLALMYVIKIAGI